MKLLPAVIRFGTFALWVSALIGFGSIQSASVFAQGNPVGVIQYRQKVMGAISGHLGGVGQILKHRLDYKAHIPQHARSLVELAKLLPDIFPEGSGKGKTDALPKIWQDMDGFKAAARKLGKEATILAKVAEGGDVDQILGQTKQVGKACGGCHKKFRQPKKKRYSWKK